MTAHENDCFPTLTKISLKERRGIVKALLLKIDCNLSSKIDLRSKTAELPILDTQ